jgi:hypothetical protein
VLIKVFLRLIKFGTLGTCLLLMNEEIKEVGDVILICEEFFMSCAMAATLID